MTEPSSNTNTSTALTTTMTTPEAEEDPMTKPTPPTNSHFFQPLELCDLTFARPFQVFAQNWKCFLTIALFASGLRAFLAFLFDVVNGENYGATYGTEADVAGYYDVDYNTNQKLDAATMTMNLVDNMILYVVTCLAVGATVQAVAEMYAGQPPVSPVVALGTAAFKAVPLVGSCFVVTAALLVVMLLLSIPVIASGSIGALYVMLLLFVVFSVYVSLVTFLMYPAIIVENKGMMDSIQRSIKLTHGNLGQVFVVCFLYGIFQSVLGTVVVAMTMQYELDGSPAAFYSRAVLSFGINTFFIAINAIIKSVIYFNIRIKDEQLTQDKLLSEMGFLNPYTQMDDNAKGNNEKDIVVEPKETSTENEVV